jgi:ABC-2 type transport system ATP-binding protein
VIRLHSIDKAKLILNGSLRDVKAQFRTHTYAVQFKGMMFGFANSLWADYALENSYQLDEEHAVAHVKLLKGNTLNNLLQTVMPVVEIQSVNEVMPTMNDIFIRAVKGEKGGQGE